MISFSLDKHSEVGLLDHMVVPFLILRGTSTDEWIKKMWHIYTMEYYSAKERNEIELFVVRWMDLETVI